jgi:hypothetical protein
MAKLSVYRWKGVGNVCTSLANEGLIYCIELRNEEGENWSAVPKESVAVSKRE